jgi:uncharacterized membrane-anchored protein
MKLWMVLSLLLWLAVLKQGLTLIHLSFGLQALALTVAAVVAASLAYAHFIVDRRDRLRAGHSQHPSRSSQI